jgi:hypothetical protein
MEYKFYKIRNKETGLFSKGGIHKENIWNKNGKSWSTLRLVKSHIKQFFNYAWEDDTYQKTRNYPYDNAEIVEVIIDYCTSIKTDIDELINEMNNTRNK